MRISRLFAWVGFALLALSVVLSLHSSAFAQAATADSGTTISFGGLAKTAAPYILEILSTVITLVIAWAAAQFSKLTSINVDEKWRESIHQAAMTGVSAALAKSEIVAADFKVDVHNNMVADAINWVMRSVPDAINGLGVGPDAIRQVVLSKFTQLAETGVNPSMSGTLLAPASAAPISVLQSTR